MKKKHLGLIVKITPTIISAMGGALMVYSRYDDSPGGSLLGLLMILLATYIVIKEKAV